MEFGTFVDLTKN